MDNQTLHLRIRNRDSVILEEDIAALSAINQKGSFDILPTHGNFISLIEKNITIYSKDNKKTEFPLEGGLLKVYNNKIDIFLGTTI